MDQGTQPCPAPLILPQPSGASLPHLLQHHPLLPAPPNHPLGVLAACKAVPELGEEMQSDAGRQRLHLPAVGAKQLLQRLLQPTLSFAWPRNAGEREHDQERGDMIRREGTCWQEDAQLKKAQLEGTAGAWGSRD